MSDPWTSPASDAPATRAPTPAPVVAADASHDAVDVARAVAADLARNPGGYIASGMAYLVFAMVTVVAVLLILFGSVAPGLFLDNELLTGIGGAFGFLVYFLVLFALAIVAVPLMSASLMRVIDGAQRGEAELGIGSLVSHARHNWVQVCLFYFLHQALMTFGMLFLYIPGLVAGMVGLLAFPLVVLEDESIPDAYRRAWAHVRQRIGWHVAVWALALGAFVVLELTIVGLLVLFPLLCAWQVFTYRLAFGIGPGVASESAIPSSSG